MRVELIEVPVYLDREDPVEQTGPRALIRCGAAQRLAGEGHEARTVTVDCRGEYRDERDAVTAIARSVAAAVRDATARGATPIVLAGNCATSIGGAAALTPERAGLIWFDAHGDFNTPATSPSGMINGMPLSILAGRCLDDVRRTIIDAPIRESAILIAGVRETDAAEGEALAESGVHVATADSIRERGVTAAAAPALAAMAGIASEVHVHIDVDGADPEDVPGVSYRTRDGVAATDVLALIDAVRSHFTIRSASIAEYIPAFDRDHATRDFALAALGRLVGS